MEPTAEESTASALGAGSRVLVTGGAGFIGSHLVDHLLQRGCSVHVLDDLSTGSRSNLAAASRSPRLTLTIGSAADVTRVEPLVAGATHVFHLAGAVGVRRLADAPLLMIERNLRPTETVLAAAAKASVPTLIASSSEVYGGRPVPFCEDDAVQPGATEGLRGGYACAKAMGEWLAMAHAFEHGLPVVVARLFNTVGPRQSGRYGMVLPRFLAQALANQPITVFGDGAQTRCFAHVGDVVRALAQLLEQPAARGRVFNVGSDREITVADLAQLVRRSAGSSSEIVCTPMEAVFPRGFTDPARRVPSLLRLRQVLGWVPSTPLEAVVQELVSAVALEAQTAAG